MKIGSESRKIGYNPNKRPGMLTAVHASAIIRLCPPVPSSRARRTLSRSHELGGAGDFLATEAILDLEEALDSASPSDRLLYEEWEKRDRGLPGGDICALPESRDVRKLCKEILHRHQNGNALSPCCCLVMNGLAAVLLLNMFAIHCT